MSLRLVTPAVGFPATLAEAKAHCRVLHDAEDSLIEAYLAAATDYVEQFTGRSILSQTWELVLDDFCDAIRLPKGPVSSITSVKYFDVDSTEQTVPTGDYALDLVSIPQWLVRASTAAWPTVADGVNNVTIRFVAGAATAPASIKLAVLMLVGNWYLNREAVNVGNITSEMPLGVAALIKPFRIDYGF